MTIFTKNLDIEKMTLGLFKMCVYQL